MNKILSILVLMSCSACSLAPLSNLYTGRSLGKGEMNLSVGAYGIGGSWAPDIKFDVGLSDNIDIGILYEALAMGALLKYSIINNKEGLSLALAGSAGSTLGGSYWYAGSVVSYKSKIFEPYFAARYNSVKWDSQNISVSSSYTFSTGTTSFSYMYYTLGSMIWFTNFVGLSAEYSLVGSSTGGFSMSSAGLYAAALVFRF